MIAKTKDPASASNRFEQAGAAAEEQMAYYLRREFGDDDDIFILNDLRLSEDGDTAQIDHLVLHRFGFSIVESKSVSGEIEINEHDEWTRKWGQKRTGMPSPIQQAKRQAAFLQRLLIKHRADLRDKRLFGRVQAGFKHCTTDVHVAVSDRGIIKRHGADPPALTKADLICDRIREEIERHRKASRLLSRTDGDYGLWQLSDAELVRVCDFLLARHTPRTTSASEAATEQEAPRPRATDDAGSQAHSDSTTPRCKHCGSGDLFATYGKYGYYFKCRACTKNTPIDYACSACGKEGRIRKAGTKFHRVCAACELEELVWSQPSGV